MHSVASGYVALAFGTLFALASVPMALHFLGQEGDVKKKFALWVLLTQTSGYLQLIDMGMTGSVSRLLIDHKDKRQTGMYGGLIRTGWLVMLVQAAIVLCGGVLLSPWITRLLKIEPALADQFIKLLRWQSALVALSFSTRMFSQLLYAHQRQDLVNYMQVGQLAVSFLAMWTGFKLRQGVFSVLWATAAGTLFSTCAEATFALRLRLFPGRGQWGVISWSSFREIFNFGKDLFLVAVGAQLIVASQAIIISRHAQSLGLEAVALWGVGTKMFNLLSQLLWRVWDFSGPAFSEMIARGERVWLRTRYRTLTILTASLSGWAAIIYILCNSSFVTLWTHGRFHWPVLYDLLLAAWTVILALGHCHNSFLLWTKEVGLMRFVFLVEGASCFILGSVFSGIWGLAGIIMSSIFCSTILSLTYGIVQISRYFGFSLRELIWEWQWPMVKVLALLAPMAAAVWLSSRALPLFPRLLINGLFGAGVGGFLFLRIGIPPDFQQEVLTRAPRVFNPILRRAFKIPALT
jgi:hypothetical protein